MYSLKVRKMSHVRHATILYRRYRTNSPLDMKSHSRYTVSLCP
jgi:hypothetical protein